MRADDRTGKGRDGKVRYAVIGQGYISQVAVLPAFAHAKDSSELVALVSDDQHKLEELSRQYKVDLTCGYEDYDTLLAGGDVDAVYIALPNNLHRDYAVKAARAGVHVLCEKPMALTEEDCEAMIAAAAEGGVKLMIAYRLHFERTNLEAIEIARSGEIGEPRFFTSSFSMQVRDEDNIRLDRERGGGTLWDIGVYCINAARYLFRDEPVEALAVTASNGEPRFREVEEMTSAILRFPGERLATFTCSFGAADVASYRLVGTAGDVRVEPAYEYAEGLRYHLTVDGKTSERSFGKRDQFAAELLYFSACVLDGGDPEPSGAEGLADVRVVQALYRSAETGRRVKLDRVAKADRPDLRQEIRRPPAKEPKLVNAERPSKE